MSTAVNAGTWLAVLPGFFFDRFGPKPTLLIGVFMLTLGYLLMAGAAAGYITVNVTGAVCFAFLYGHGSSWAQTAVTRPPATDHRPPTTTTIDPPRATPPSPPLLLLQPVDP